MVIANLFVPLHVIMKMCLTLTVVLLLPICSMAQTDTITGKVHELEGVTVTETLQRHTLTSTAPLHILDKRDMLTMGVVDIADALHRLPGITLRDYGGAGGMKTVSVRGFGAKHTGVCYDGVMLSDCQSGEIDLSRYSLDNVDYLSLIVGDNDDIFIPARNATTPATLNIQTLSAPTDDSHPHLTAQLKVGSFGYVCPFFRYAQSLSDRFALSAVGEYTYAENDYPYEIQNVTQTVSDRRTNSRMNSGHAEVNFVYYINPVNRLAGKVYYYDNDRQLPGQVRYYTNISGETLRDRNAFGQLTYQTRWGDRLSLKVLGKMNWAESVYKDALMAGGVNDASYWQREVYTSAALLYTPHRLWALDYSADYSFNNLNGSSWRTVVGKPYRHTILQTASAKYRSNRLTVLARLLWSIYLNGQNEEVQAAPSAPQQNTARNMRRLSPSLSVSYQLLADYDLYVRASYKNIFRSPTFNESYYYHYGSTDLRPESTDQLNVGITYAAQPSQDLRFTLTLDGYYNHVKDMIVAVPHDMFVWTCINIDKVSVYGMDATLKGSWQFAPQHKVLLAANYTYQRAKNRNNPASPYYNNQIAYIPKYTGSMSLTWENPWVNLSLHGVGVSSRWPNNEHYEGTMVKAYTDCGLTMWRQLRWGKCRVEGRFDLRNVFDMQYEIVARYPMPGRSYQFTLSIKY